MTKSNQNLSDTFITINVPYDDAKLISEYAKGNAVCIYKLEDALNTFEAIIKQAVNSLDSK